MSPVVWDLRDLDDEFDGVRCVVAMQLDDVSSD